jgi:hypothetical protein
MSGLMSISAKYDKNDSKVSISPVNNINVKVNNTPSETHIGERSVKTEGLDHSNDPYGQRPKDWNDPYGQRPEETRSPYTSDLTVKYKDDVNDKIDQYERTIAALKIIITMMRENPLYLNALILTDDVKLAELVRLLTGADEVIIDAEDIGANCFAKTYRKVIAIYVIKNGNTKNLKYDYPEIMKELKDIGINTKFVW